MSARLALADQDHRAAVLGRGTRAYRARVAEGYAPELDHRDPAVITYTTMVASAALNELLERLVGFGDRAPYEVRLRVHERMIRPSSTPPAPQHTMTMQTGSPKFFGAAAAKSITIKDSAAFHFDEALRSLRFSNISRNSGDWLADITGGSAAPGSADYLINITGGPGIQH